jgi:hypothetical protein
LVLVVWAGGFTLLQTLVSEHKLNPTSSQGDKCLAKSKEYNQLNSLTSVYAVRQLYATTLDKYIADGPTKWANEMVADITKSKHAFNGYLRAPFGGVSIYSYPSDPLSSCI